MLVTVEHVASSPPALALAALVATYVVARLVTWIGAAILVRLARRTASPWDDQVVERLAGLCSGLLALGLFRVALGWIDLDARAAELIGHVCAIAMIGIVVWAGFRAVDLARAGLETRSWAREHPSSRSLLALAARFTKVSVLVFGALVGLSQLGVSVASLIAGLGIGGLVFALAAQKTVENLFGAVSIGIDQPLREGDFVKVYDFVGTVEKIGLRSTRIRTLDRTIVTIPNGELANQRVESYAARDRIRLATVIGLEYDTTAAQMQEVLGAFDAILRTHPKIWPDAVVVRFVRRVVARRRDHGVVPDARLRRVPTHPAASAARVHVRDRSSRREHRVSDAHAARPQRARAVIRPSSAARPGARTPAASRARRGTRRTGRSRARACRA